MPPNRIGKTWERRETRIDIPEPKLIGSKGYRANGPQVASIEMKRGAGSTTNGEHGPSPPTVIPGHSEFDQLSEDALLAIVLCNLSIGAQKQTRDGGGEEDLLMEERQDESTPLEPSY